MVIARETLMIEENDDNEVAVLELLALNPCSYFPALPSELAEELARKGQVMFSDGWWYLTAKGLSRTGRILH
ncbi:MAG TPA: hypothetical protein VIG52_09640 [Methyloceanibacter sp.]|jgi:hypothetical protein